MQETLVAVAVIAAVGMIVRRYAPAALRVAGRRQMANLAARLGWRRLEQRWRAPTTAAGSCADGCANCSGCAPVVRPRATEHRITPEALRKTARH